MDPLRPNLERIPGDGDARAERILRGLPRRIDAATVAALDDGDVLALGRYGARQVVVALRTRSKSRLRDALTAAALSERLRMIDPRDTMVALAPFVHVARELGVKPARLFAGVARRLPKGDVATLLRVFGARDDVTLESFLWRLVDTPDGPDIVPAPWGSP
ncbi:hypothetical protein [Jiangella mangrovi]|uniref:Uncharacterized protein n=1 Tax=Jiangella mangrovi TaxID=1524084 RepID=A0A7W9GX89_9ACTN|nr:hypothetical protein [Jiangella mangrovi]MBB5791439.1 hypothetical protein [Jiangella mangrovi]